MSNYILKLSELNKDMISLVGGKGANLGELTKVENIRLSDGYCITTDAYKKVYSGNKEINSLIAELDKLKITDTQGIKDLGIKIRSAMEKIDIPDEIVSLIKNNLKSFGEKDGYAIRSSATAEDLPSASFAGQHDSYLNIVGANSILEYIKKCWSSLYTHRAIVYRMRNNFDHRKVFISIIVQKMIEPYVSGVVFTADPLTSNKRLLKIDASFGLGEAFVSGIVNSDVYSLVKGAIKSKKVSEKKQAIYPQKDGGTKVLEVNSADKKIQVLGDRKILELEAIGRRIEAHFGCSQDIEWCLKDDVFYILQSRPITTLYPIPEAKDGKNRVFMSAGHMQMMTDPIKPLGMFFFDIAICNNMAQEIGGRAYQDISNDLTSFMGRKMSVFLLKTIGETLMLKSVQKIIGEKETIKALPKGNKRVFSMKNSETPLSFLPHYIRMNRENDPQNVKKVIDHDQKVIEELRQRIQKLQGDELFKVIDHEQRVLKRTVVTPASVGVLTTGLLPDRWINGKLKKWLDIDNAADMLTQCVPNSITADMGFDLLDVSDEIRKYPQVVEYLESAEDESFFEKLEALEGGSQASDAIGDYLKKYGMRCSGDVDITRDRWIEKPTQLVPIILSNIKNYDGDSREIKFSQGLKQSTDKIDELLSKIEKLPSGKRKAKKMAKRISVMRNHIGYREYPKHAFIERYLIFKQALLKEADKLKAKNVIKSREDIYYLHFDELRDVVNGKELDYSIITKRKEDYIRYEKLTPPRIMSIEQGAILSDYDSDDESKNMLQGIPVSAGVVKGRARVILSMDEANIEDGDILVTSFTDPSWTPLFVSLSGLVTEVGGLTTHGAIIAREYGLPAVVSVENATTLIKDGDIIRVDGTKGTVEILPE